MTNNYTLNQCRQRLLELTELKDGWFDGHGKVISMAALNLADKVLVASTLRPYIYPMYEGGVNFEWDTDTDSLALSFKPNSMWPDWISIDYVYDSDTILGWAHNPDSDPVYLISSIIEAINNFKV